MPALGMQRPRSISSVVGPTKLSPIQNSFVGIAGSAEFCDRPRSHCFKVDSPFSTDVDVSTWKSRHIPPESTPLSGAYHCYPMRLRDLFSNPIDIDRGP